MRVVIPYKKVPNNDLYWAIRSIIINYEPLEKIIVVGDKPDFAGDYEYIPCPEQRDKEFSIYHKLRQVDGPVLFSNDDIFFMNRVHDIPNYYLGTCGEKKGPMSPYYKRMYDKCPPTWLDFDAHCPMVINTTFFMWRQGMPLKSQYGNMFNVPGVLVEDFKIKTVEDIDRTRPFLSTPEPLSRFVEPLLRELFA